MKKLFGALAIGFLLSACGQPQSSVMEEIEKAQKAQADAAAANIETSKAYLEENKKKPGVMVTASGLQYEIVRAGDTKAPAPGPDATANVHYEGTLPNGTVFDSSYARGQTAQFPVNRVIAGWTEALQLMHPGSEFRLVIPSDIAYGEGGSPPDIPGNQVLIFKVELLGYRDASGKIVGTF